MPDPAPSSDKSADHGTKKRHDAFIAVPASFVGAAIVAAFTHFVPPTSAQSSQPDLTKNADFARVQELGGDLIANTTNDIKVEGQIVKKLDSIETKIDRLIDRLLESRTEKP